MSIDTKRDEITVAGITYDVERNDSSDYTSFTLSLDGEPVFEGIEGRVGYDEFAQEHANPRDWSNIGTISVSYRSYDLGDEDISKVEFQRGCERCDGSGTIGVEGPQTERDANYWRGIVEYECSHCEGSSYIDESPIDYFKRERGARVVLPLIVYEHSGITMSVGHVGDIVGDSAGWDTSFVGFIFDTPEGIEECHGMMIATDEEIEERLRNEIEIYASYLEGDVTEFTVNDDETDFHVSCGGFIGGYGEHAISECFDHIELAITARIAENAERAEMAARDIITI